MEDTQEQKDAFRKAFQEQEEDALWEPGGYGLTCFNCGSPNILLVTAGEDGYFCPDCSYMDLDEE